MTKALTVDEAAIELRKTKRWLKDWLKANPVDEAGIPFYIPLGRSKTFEPSDIARIRAHFGKETRKESVIYFVYASGHIKIGYATDWRRRLKDLQVANPEKIQVLLIIGRPKIYEKTMHTQFAEHRVNGEWFKDHPSIREFIAGHKDECWYRAGRLQ